MKRPAPTLKSNVGAGLKRDEWQFRSYIGLRISVALHSAGRHVCRKPLEPDTPSEAFAGGEIKAAPLPLQATGAALDGVGVGVGLPTPTPAPSSGHSAMFAGASFAGVAPPASCNHQVPPEAPATATSGGGLERGAPLRASTLSNRLSRAFEQPVLHQFVCSPALWKLSYS